MRGKGVVALRWTAVAVVTFALAMGALVFLRERRSPSMAPLQRIARAAASLSYRVTEARLSSDTTYHPPLPQTRGSSAREAEKNLELLTAAAAFESPESLDLHASALARIYLGEPDIATARIEQSLERADANHFDAKRRGRLWNDLAVARLQQVERGGESRLLVSALDAAERARAVDHDDPAIVWTRAVLLEKLSNRRSALDAWQEFLRLDASSPWAAEARRHVETLSAPLKSASFGDATRVQLYKALVARDADRAREIVRAFPKDARLYGEDELLPEWAKTRDDEPLQAARELANALVVTTGESLLADAVDQIANADAGTRDRIAAALIDYKSARDAYRAKQVELARQRLAVAEKALVAAKSPMAVWANVYRASSTYSSNQFSAALNVFDASLDPCDRKHRYYAACGAKNWIQGLASVQSGHPEASLASYERGLEAFRAAQERDGIATVLTLRAETLDFMSALDEAWADRMASLEMFASFPMSTRPLIWMAIAQAAVRDHQDRAAAIIFDEVATDARESGEAMWFAEAVLWRLLATNRIDGKVSETDVEAARAAVDRIEDPRIRARSQANLGLVLADIRGSEPVARGDLDHALEFYRQSDDQFNRTAALAQRASVHATMDDLDAAGTDLVAALNEFQRQSAEMNDPLMRTVFSERSRELFLGCSKLQAARGNAFAALWLSDRARLSAARNFRGDAAPPDANAEALGRALVRNVPAGITVVHQDLDGDQLRTWVVRDGEPRLFIRSVNAPLLRADIAEFRLQLQTASADEEVLPRARHLYDVLLAPEREAFSGDGVLVYSPSPELRGLPVGALHDGEKFLIETRPVAVARSVASLASFHPRSAAAEPASVLVVGAAQLNGVEEETAALAKRYGSRAVVLSGPQATPAAFTSEAPRYDVIHVGAHGRTDRRPLQNAIELDSGRRLRAFDVMNLSLPKSPIVVLGGCSTDDETTGRATLSLAGAFANAGASAVIGSLWDVDDMGAMRLLVKFHDELGASVSVCDALRRAQLLARRNHESVAVWAAFQVHI